MTIPATVDGKSQPQTVPNVTGKTGDIVTVNVPTIQGYTSDKTTVKATVNADGTITTDESVTYTPNSVTADVTIPATVDGKSQPQTVPNVTGKTGDVVTVNVPTIQGYTPDKTTVEATVNPDGTITTDESVAYTPNSVTANVTIPATVDGKSQPQTVPDVTGKTGDVVTVNVPTIQGYTPDKTTVKATVNADGTITTDESLVYSPNSVTADVTIPATVDGKSQPQTVSNVTGNTGDKVTVNVPTLDGYTADKKTVSAIVNPDGTITTTDTVVYTANATTPTDNNGGTTNPTDTDTNTVTPPTDGQKPETTDPTDTSTDQAVVTNPVEIEKSNSEVVDEPAATPTQVDQPAVHEVTSPSVAVSDKHAANYETDKASKLPQTDEHSAIAASLLGLVSLIGLLGFGKRKRAK